MKAGTLSFAESSEVGGLIYGSETTDIATEPVLAVGTVIVSNAGAVQAMAAQLHTIGVRVTAKSLVIPSLPEYDANLVLIVKV